MGNCAALVTDAWSDVNIEVGAVPYVSDNFINQHWNARPVRGPRWRFDTRGLAESMQMFERFGVDQQFFVASVDLV